MHGLRKGEAEHSRYEWRKSKEAKSLRQEKKIIFVIKLSTFGN